jgi:hypothetical protein
VRHLPAALLLAAALAGAAAWAAERAAPPRVSESGSVWRYREGDLLYRFHAALRVEGLFDLGADPYETKDLAAARVADLERMRAAFLRLIGAPDLQGVPKSGEEWLKMIPGYYPSIGEGGR